jgi:hypothetical protein
MSLSVSCGKNDFARFVACLNDPPNDTLWQYCRVHQGREFIAIGALENGAFCTVFSENFHKF